MLDTEFLMDTVLFFQLFDYVTSLSFGLHYFWWVVNCQFYYGFLLHGSFFSYCFQNCLSLVFNSLTVKCLWLSLYLIWGPLNFLDLLNVSHKILEVLVLFLQILILTLFFKTPHYTYFRMFDVVPEVSEVISFFSPSSRLYSVY